MTNQKLEDFRAQNSLKQDWNLDQIIQPDELLNMGDPVIEQVSFWLIPGNYQDDFTVLG
jgi:hypothetical protein